MNDTYMTLEETKGFLSLDDAEILENVMKLGFPLPRNLEDGVLERFFVREEIEQWINHLNDLDAK